MIRLAVRRPVAVTMAYLAVTLLGVAAWRNLPIELLPETALPRLSITAAWPGASPETMEAFVTSRLEAAAQQVRGIRRVVSESYEEQGQGMAELTLEFAHGTDMEFARLELAELLAALEAELPAGVRPRLSPYVPEEFEAQRRPFLMYTLTGPYTVEALRAIIDRTVAPELRRLDGVAEVVALGGRDRVLELELDEDRLAALGLTPQDVRARLSDLEIVAEAGALEEGGTVRALAIRESARSLAEILALPLRVDRGRVVRVRDVARVRDTYADPTEHYRIDGLPAASFVVLREPRTNAVAVADRVKARVAALGRALPPGTRLLLDSDQSATIRAQLSDLRFRALVAAAVVYLVLLLFLGSLRAAALTFATIAFSLMITVNLLYFGGFTLNLLTLMGLAMGFGLIVDNAIVVLENVDRHRRAGEPAATAAERGARDVALAVVAATLTTAVVLVPFVYLQGELRIYYVPLALVVGLALVASLFVAFTFIPAAAARLLPDPPRAPAPGAPPRPPIYVRAYAGLVRAAVRHPWPGVLLAAALLAGSWRLFDRHVVRGVLWGAWGEETYISIQIQLPRGEEIERTDALARHFEARLAAIPAIERFVTRVRPQYAAIRVTFPDSLEHTAVPVLIKEELTAYSLQFGGAEVRVYGFGPSFYGGGASPPNYSIQVLGYNYQTVREIAEDLARRLRRFSRIRDVDPNASARWYVRDRPTEIALRLHRDRLAAHGLTVRDVVRQVAAAVGGRAELRAQPVRIGGDEVALSVKLAGYRAMDVLALQELLVPAPGGAGVRLGDVASLETRAVLPRIRRENQQYERRVSYEFRGPVRLGDRVQAAVVRSTRLPAGYSLVTRDEWRWAEEERRQLYAVLALALLLVFMVTAALFESIRQPVCMLLTVPMALIGVFLVFFYTGATFTREAYVGVIMMGGIVVNNAILLVDHVNAVRRTGLPLEDAIVRGTLERVRPILMTTLTTLGGLLPLVLFAESADANIWNALAYALAGGLASSTVLVLTITPALYLLFERRAARRAAARPEDAPPPAAR